MKIEEIKLREDLHDLKCSRLRSLNPGNFVESIATKLRYVEQLELTGGCIWVPPISCGYSKDAWLKVLKLNWETWQNVVNSQPYDFLAFEIFGLRSMNYGMKSTVESIIEFYFNVRDKKPLDNLSPAVIGFITDIEFFSATMYSSHSSEHDFDFLDKFYSPLLIGENRMQAWDGPGDDCWQFFYITHYEDLDDLMAGVVLFIEDIERG